MWSVRPFVVKICALTIDVYALVLTENILAILVRQCEHLAGPVVTNFGEPYNLSS